MFSFNSVKFLLIFLLVQTLFSACQSQQKVENDSNAKIISVNEELKSDVPFSGREPETFQAEFIVTANGKEDKTFAARNGSNHLLDYNFGEKKSIHVFANC